MVFSLPPFVAAVCMLMDVLGVLCCLLWFFLSIGTGPGYFIYHKQFRLLFLSLIFTHSHSSPQFYYPLPMSVSVCMLAFKPYLIVLHCKKKIGLCCGKQKTKQNKCCKNYHFVPLFLVSFEANNAEMRDIQRRKRSCYICLS